MPPRSHNAGAYLSTISLERGRARTAAPRLPRRDVIPAKELEIEAGDVARLELNIRRLALSITRTW